MREQKRAVVCWDLPQPFDRASSDVPWLHDAVSLLARARLFPSADEASRSITTWVFNSGAASSEQI